jgi:hypothetical protein
MNCPSCGFENPEGTTECVGCGIVFEKWKARRVEELLTPPPSEEVTRPIPVPSRPVPELPTFAILEKLAVPILLVILAGAFFGYRSCTEEVVVETAAAAPEDPPLQGRAAAAPTGFDASKGLSRLDPLLEEIRSEAEMYGFTVSLGDLRSWFEKEAKPLAPGVARYRGEEAGLSPLEVQEFDSREEREVLRGIVSRCSINGKWVYDVAMPESGPDEGVTECWHRPWGRKSSLMVNAIAFTSAPMSRWERYTWQPRNRRWAPYSEADEGRILEHIIDKEYGYDAESKDRENASEQIRMIEDRPAPNEYSQKENLKWAVLGAYRSRVIREGALYRIEVERARVP